MQLTKTLNLRDKTIAELRHYETLQTKRLTKTEELLEEANRTIINHEMRQINDRMEVGEEREQHEMEVEGLKERIGRSEGEEVDDVQGSLRMLARAIRFGESQRVEELQDTQEFKAVRKYFGELEAEAE